MFYSLTSMRVILEVIVAARQHTCISSSTLLDTCAITYTKGTYLFLHITI